MTANNYITVDSNSVAIPQVWSNMLLNYLPNYLSLARTVNRDFEKGEISQSGDTINITKPGSLSVNDKAKGTNVTLQTPSATKLQLVLNKHKEVTFGEEDVAKIFSKPDMLQGYIIQAAIKLAEQVEADLAALILSASNSYNASSTVDQTALRRARRILVQNKVPQNAPLYAYLDPTAVETLPLNSALVMGDKAPVVDGTIAKLSGLNIFEGQLVYSAGSPLIYHCPVYAEDAMTLAVRPLPDDAEKYGGAKQSTVVNEESGLAIRTTMSYNPNALGPQVTLDILYGVLVTRPEHMVDLYHV